MSVSQQQTADRLAKEVAAAWVETHEDARANRLERHLCALETVESDARLCETWETSVGLAEFWVPSRLAEWVSGWLEASGFDVETVSGRGQTKQLIVS